MKPAEDSVEEYVSGCIQLATLLEVSAYPKPGNVHRTADFSDTRYEHFLASSIAIGQALRDASRRGTEVSSGRIGFEEVGIGSMISEAVSAMMSWQHGGNTILGAILLLMPIAVAAGYVWSGSSPSIGKLRSAIPKVTHSATPEDAVHVYEAISMCQPGGLGSVERFDVKKEASRGEIIDAGVSLLDIFQLSSKYDSVSSEWVHDYTVTFEIGHPYFVSQLEEIGDHNIVTVHTFLKILSTVPDTLIARKVGKRRAKDISNSAREILLAGGLRSTEGKKRLADLDKRLRSDGHRLNPGTTADLTTSSLAVAALDGYRP